MKGSTLYGKKLPGLQCEGYEDMGDGKSKSSPFQNIGKTINEKVKKSRKEKVKKIKTASRKTLSRENL